MRRENTKRSFLGCIGEGMRDVNNHGTRRSINLICLQRRTNKGGGGRRKRRRRRTRRNGQIHQHRILSINTSRRLTEAVLLRITISRERGEIRGRSKIRKILLQSRGLLLGGLKKFAFFAVVVAVAVVAVAVVAVAVIEVIVVVTTGEW